MDTELCQNHDDFGGLATSAIKSQEQTSIDIKELGYSFGENNEDWTFKDIDGGNNIGFILKNNHSKENDLKVVTQEVNEDGSDIEVEIEDQEKKEEVEKEKSGNRGVDEGHIVIKDEEDSTIELNRRVSLDDIRKSIINKLG